MPVLAASVRPAQPLQHFSGLARSQLEAGAGAGGYHRAGQAVRPVPALEVRLSQVLVVRPAVGLILHLHWRWHWPRHWRLERLVGLCLGLAVRR